MLKLSNKTRQILLGILIILGIALILTILFMPEDRIENNQAETEKHLTIGESVELEKENLDKDTGYPKYSGQPYAVIHNNIPYFEDEELKTESFESYSELDELGRCGVAIAGVGQDIMPTEDRGSIGSVKPSGWQTAKYDCVDGKYLYNRCHLIGFQLTGENANKGNLITGTRSMNVDGMLPFENMIADYVKETGNHVLYRVTPVFVGENLVANGVLMEAKSVEDNGEGILFCVYVYNVQEGVEIDYATGNSRLATQSDKQNGQEKYILNTNNKKIHKPDCHHVEEIKEENREEYIGSKEDLLGQGYVTCGNCKP